MIRSTCAYLQCHGSTLLLYRDKKKDDVNHDYCIGVGGKFEPHETPRRCIRREVYEETGLLLEEEEFRYRGKLYFHYPSATPEIIWIYTAEVSHQETPACDEGTLFWVRNEEVLNQKLWEGDRIFLKRMMSSETCFCFELNYDESGCLIHWEEKEAEHE
jgi:8-oxo-dGTP diphosphatase